jgi:hypothetical protein
MTDTVTTAHLVDQPDDREALCGEPVPSYHPGPVRQCQACYRIAMLLVERRERTGQ